MRKIEYANKSGSKKIFEQFNIKNREWIFPKKGDFWKAINYAHSQNILGQGKEVAIIDGDFDEFFWKGEDNIIPVKGIKKSILYNRHYHGTYVTLLIHEVAPSAKLFTYDVSNFLGKVSKLKVKKTIDQLHSSSEVIVNFSIGEKEHLSRALKKTTCTCELCTWFERISSIKTVISAAGNDIDYLFCPSRNENIFGIGFFSLQKSNNYLKCKSLLETKTLDQPSYDQSPLTDYSLLQPKDVVGSSFAAPLISGAACLMDNPSDLGRYIRAANKAGIGEYIMANSIESWTVDPGNNNIGVYFDEALEILPHKHWEDNSYCVGCSLFARNIYINAGLYYLHNGQTELSEKLLKSALILAPWSYEAAKNLSVLYSKKVDYLLTNSQYTDSSILEFIEKSIKYRQIAIKNNPTDLTIQEEKQNFEQYIKDKYHNELLEKYGTSNFSEAEKLAQFYNSIFQVWGTADQAKLEVLLILGLSVFGQERFEEAHTIFMQVHNLTVQNSVAIPKDKETLFFECFGSTFLAQAICSGQYLTYHNASIWLEKAAACYDIKNNPIAEARLSIKRALTFSKTGKMKQAVKLIDSSSDILKTSSNSKDQSFLEDMLKLIYNKNE